MNISYSPTSYNSPEIKEKMVAVKYRAEQELTAKAAIQACPTRVYAIELYAGTGGLTSLYKQYFKKVETNDINTKAKTDWHLPAMKFIDQVLSVRGQIDLVDFDCYGCPALEIQEFFKKGNPQFVSCPFVLRFSDGLGLWMKRNKNSEVIRKRYLIEGDIDMTKIWLRHPELIDMFLKKLGAQYGLKVEKLISIQTKYKNYTLGAYRFTK